jgi:DNA-binding MarR family transcriptional regulator
MMKGQRRPNGGFDLAEAPSHLIRRCQQYFGDLYAREAGARELTKQQFTVLAALEHNEGVSQTALVEMTGIDRSTLAEMVRRMLERELLSRERTEEDQRANAVAITAAGRKALRSARNAADRAEKAMLDALPPSERARFVKYLVQIAAAHDAFAANGTGNGNGKAHARTRRRKI